MSASNWLEMKTTAGRRFFSRASRAISASNPAITNALSHTLAAKDAPAALNPWLEEQGVEPCEGGGLILKRTFTRTGGSAVVNTDPPTLPKVASEISTSPA